MDDVDPIMLAKNRLIERAIDARKAENQLRIRTGIHSDYLSGIGQGLAQAIGIVAQIIEEIRENNIHVNPDSNRY